ALPHVEPDTESAGEREVTHEDWHALYGDLTVRLGRCSSYFDVSDPYDQTHREPVSMSLADDLADIYRDLRNGLLSEQSAGAAPAKARLCACRSAFSNLCAAHAATALRALQTAFLVHHVEHLPGTFGAEAGRGEPDAG